MELSIGGKFNMILSEYKLTLKKKHKPRTAIFLVQETQVLLGYKKNGFGKGYYVGIGGKVEGNETVEEGALREFKEEVGIEIKPENLKQVAILDFYFPHITDESWNQQVFAYLVFKWEKDPTETDEIKPVWFDIDKLPLDKMWDDAKHWLPDILEGKKVHKEFMFDKNLKVIEAKELS